MQPTKVCGIVMTIGLLLPCTWASEPATRPVWGELLQVDLATGLEVDGRDRTVVIDRADLPEGGEIAVVRLLGARRAPALARGRDGAPTAGRAAAPEPVFSTEPRNAVLLFVHAPRKTEAIENRTVVGRLFYEDVAFFPFPDLAASVRPMPGGRLLFLVSHSLSDRAMLAIYETSLIGRAGRVRDYQRGEPPPADLAGTRGLVSQRRVEFPGAGPLVIAPLQVEEGLLTVRIKRTFDGPGIVATCHLKTGDWRVESDGEAGALRE